jgi:hypothetical protein
MGSKFDSAGSEFGPILHFYVTFQLSSLARFDVPLHHTLVWRERGVPFSAVLGREGVDCGEWVMVGESLAEKEASWGDRR